MKRAMAMALRMAGKDEGDSKSGKSNGDGKEEGNCNKEGNGK
jgi:hypothetical protein